MSNTNSVVEFYEVSTISSSKRPPNGSIVRDTTTNRLYVVDNNEYKELCPAKDITANNFAGILPFDKGGTGCSSKSAFNQYIQTQAENVVNSNKFTGILPVDKGGTGVKTTDGLYNLFFTSYTIEVGGVNNAVLAVDNSIINSDDHNGDYFGQENTSIITEYKVSVESAINFSHYQLFVDIDLSDVTDTSTYSSYLQEYQKIARVYVNPDNATEFIVKTTSTLNQKLKLNIFVIRVN